LTQFSGVLTALVTCWQLAGKGEKEHDVLLKAMMVTVMMMMMKMMMMEAFH